ncbi:hypothetical protein FXO38_03035 [Capsicum annuum]|nr:hypothetical protein FXO38_03035 [Capsicum annuum]
MVIPRLHFDLVNSGRYKDFLWDSLSFEDLARSFNNRLKAGGQFYLIQGMPLAIQVHSKPDIHVEELALSKPESHVEKEAFISKKDFDAFRDEDQVVDIEADKSNVDDGGLEQSGQHFSPDVVQSSDNISDGTKQQHADKDPDLQNMDYVGTERSPQRLSSEVDHELESNLLGKKTSNEKIDEIILSDSQFTIPDEMLPGLNAYQIKSIIIHPSANRQKEHKILDAKTSETIIEDHAQKNRGITDLSSNSLVNSEVELATEEQVRTPPNTQEVTNDKQRDEQLWLDSQNIIPNEFLPSLNVYDQTSIMIHPSVNREVKTLRIKLRIRRPSKFKESPYTKKFGSAAGSSAGLIQIFPPKHPFLYHSIDGIIDTKIVKNFKDWISVNLLKATAKSGHYAVVLAEIEKIAKIIPLCLQACDFYVKKGIDLQNHPRYKDKESSDMFDVLFEDDLPQQPSGSLDCGVFMVMYAECLSYGRKFIATEFDPNALSTRYVALLWDYGIQKQDANAISDVEAPLRPARQSRITSVTEVVDV